MMHWLRGARRLRDARDPAGSGRTDYALTETPSPGIVAIVGLKFEARIIAGPSVRAVSRGATGGGSAGCRGDRDGSRNHQLRRVWRSRSWSAEPARASWRPVYWTEPVWPTDSAWSAHLM